MSQKLNILVFFFSIGISFLLYGNTINGAFVYDDKLLLDRKDLRNITELPKSFFKPYLSDNQEIGVWRPFSTITTGLQLVIFGESPKWFHLINIFLNGVCTFLIYILISKLFHQRNLAILTSIIFAFLPIHTEAVAFIKSIEDLIASALFLISWIFFIEGTKSEKINKKFITSSVLFYLFSILSKETFVYAPFLFISVFLVRSKESIKSSLKSLSIPFYLPIILLYLLGRYLVLGKYAFGVDNASFVINPLPYVDLWTRIWTSFKILWIYIVTILIPTNLSASYHYNHIPLVNNLIYSWESIAGIFLLFLIICSLAIKRIRITPIGTGSFIFIFSYFLVSKFFISAGELMAERWMYIPSLGIVLILSYLFELLIKKYNFIGKILVIILICTYSLIIIPRNNVWLSESALYQSMVQDAPNSAHAHYLLALEYFEIKDYTTAKFEANKAFSIYNNNPSVLNLLGSISAVNKNYTEAENYYLKANSLKPTYSTYTGLAAVYYASKRFDEAIKIYESIISNKVDELNSTDFLIYATCLTKLSNYQKSIDVIQKYLSYNKSTEVKFLLAVNYYKLGQLTNSEKYFDWDNSIPYEHKLNLLNSYQ